MYACNSGISRADSTQNLTTFTAIFSIITQLYVLQLPANSGSNVKML